MKHRDAVAVLEGAVPRHSGTWVDLGSGDGTLTRALAELAGQGSRIYAMDRDASALATLTRRPVAGVDIIPVTADITGPFELPGLEGQLLDGILLANALHFVSDPGQVLGRLASRVRPGGRVVVVEYDNRAASRWVPYPISSAQWPALAGGAGLTAPVITGSRRSAFGGEIYVGVAAVTSDDARQAGARRHITAYRTKLADRGVHPDRFEKWVATLRVEVQLEAVQAAAGELSQLWGAAPGTLEARLLAASGMTEQEKEEYKRSKGTK